MPKEPELEINTPAQTCATLINQVLQMTVDQFSDAGGKVACCVGCAIPPLGLLALCLDENPFGMEIKPTTDGITFAALYVICSIEEHGNGIVCGFSPENVDKARIMFKQIMGREYTDLHPNVLALIADHKAKAADIPGHLKKFVPN